MGKNKGEQPNLEKNNEGTTDKTTEKTEKSNEESSKSSLPTNPIFLQSLFVAGILATVAASYGVQYYRDTYVIPPQKEKTFPFWKTSDLPTTVRNTLNKDALLNFVSLSQTNKGDISVRLLDGDSNVFITDLEYYEYWLPKTEIGGKFHFKYNNLVSTITYFVSSGAHDVELKLESSVRAEPGNNSNYTIVISQGTKADIVIELIDGKKVYYELPTKTGLPSENEESIENTIKTTEIEWEKTYQSLYELDKQNMPKAYQTLAQSALSYLVNSLNQKKQINLHGLYDKNFVIKAKFHFLQSSHVQLITLDEQVFPLITLSRFDSKDVLLVLNSWIQLVNELGNMGNRVSENGVHLETTQAPLLFQLIKELLPNKLFNGAIAEIQDVLETIAEQTWLNSLGKGGLKDVKWLGHSRGVFQLEPATPKGTSSFELLCLLEDMCITMNEIHVKAGEGGSSKWTSRAKEIETNRDSYWDEKNNNYGDIVNGKITPGLSSHVPLILSLLKQDSQRLAQLVQNLEQDSNYSPTGLQISVEYGAPVSTNFLLLQSLKKYSALSGPAQESAHRLYSQLKNGLIAAIARSNRLEKSFYARFDRNMRPLGSKGSLDGTLVLPIMTELSDSHN